MPEAIDLPVLYFDGVCGLCNRTVDFVLRYDRRGAIRFAPLQGRSAAEHLTISDVRQLGSVVFSCNDRLWRRSSAIVRLLRAMGGCWPCLGWLLWLIPRPLRDLAYLLIASNRYRLFGKKETCRLPTPAERARFLE